MHSRPALRRRAVGGVLPRARRCRRPTTSCGVGSAPDGEQVARIMHAFEPVADGRAARPRARLRRHEHDARRRAVVRAPARSRSRTSRPGCARSTDSMPEERNRVLTDHLSDLLLCSTETAVDEPRRARASTERRRAGRRRDGRRRRWRWRRSRAQTSDALGAARPAGRALPARDGASRRQRRRPGGARPAGGDAARRCRCRRSSRCIPRTRERLADAGVLARLEQARRR